MATGTNGIATIAELMTGKGLSPPAGSYYDPNKCPIAYEVSTMGGTTSGYQANQLVKYSDVSKVIRKYTLTITTSITYSSLALFLDFPTHPNPSYSYKTTSPVAPGEKHYRINFSQGYGISVNQVNYPNNPAKIHDGQKYRVYGKVYTGSPWTYIATLTHVDADRNEYI